ncbi:MAG TPA: ribose-phosphate pyrophosphokinase [Candidatus Limnocylindrales bacterium]|nr:ribose-phosphate pyrophosphokinase [Candidatus Limnocylindrales bacterium]
MKIFSGSSNKPLSEKTAKILGLNVSPIELFIFPDGERRIKLNDNVVDDDTVVIQSTATPVDQNYTELFFIIDALKRSGAKSVTTVIPYLGYQRQDHVFRDGESVSLQVMVKLLESLNVDKVIMLDLHSIKIPEFFHVPIIHLSALPLFAEEIRKIQGEDKNSILISPDMGGLRRIQKMSDLLDNMPWVATVKDRDLDTGNIDISKIDLFESGLTHKDLKGKKAFIVDDMTSSGKTLVKSSQLLNQYGVEEIYAFITHPIFSADAPHILQKSTITKVFTTDSVFIPEEKHFPKLEVLSISKMISENL